MIKYILLAAAMLACGCVRGNDAAYDGVSAAYPMATLHIAQDAAQHLAGMYPPGQTRLALYGADLESPFGQALEGALRRRGFTVSDAGIPIRYQLDMLQGEAAPACYLSLRLPDGVITRSYALQGDSVVPDAILSKSGLPAYSEAPPMPGPAPAIQTALNELAAPKAPGAAPASLAPLPLAKAPVAPVPAIAPQAKTPEPAPMPAPTAPAAPVAVAKAAPAVAQEPPMAEAWQISPGLLQAQLKAWCGRAGYQLVWKPKADYQMHSAAIFRGEFISAIDKLFTRLHMHGNPLRVSIYRANSVVEVNED